MGTASSKADAVKTPVGEVPQLKQLVQQIQSSLAADDKSYRFREYKQVLVGSEVVDWMQQKPWCVPCTFCNAHVTNCFDSQVRISGCSCSGRTNSD